MNIRERMEKCRTMVRAAEKSGWEDFNVCDLEVVYGYVVTRRVLTERLLSLQSFGGWLNVYDEDQWSRLYALKTGAFPRSHWRDIPF